MTATKTKKAKPLGAKIEIRECPHKYELKITTFTYPPVPTSKGYTVIEVESTCPWCAGSRRVVRS